MGKNFPPALNRRRFLGTLSASLFVASVVGEAQRARRTYRIGWLIPTAVEGDTFREALRAVGYVEGLLRADQIIE